MTETSKPFNLRLSYSDLKRLKAIAQSETLSCSTLLRRIILKPLGPRPDRLTVALGRKPQKLNKDNDRISIYFSPPQRIRLDKTAKKAGLTITELARNIIETWLEKYQQEDAD